jgi:quinoprotein glucose dehydrogenase
MRMLFALLVSFAVVGTVAAAAPDAGWSAYGGDAGGTRYSPLTEITPSNVGQLRVAWTFRTGELGQGVKDWSRSAFEATPILHDGTLFHHQQHGRGRGECPGRNAAVALR